MKKLIVLLAAIAMVVTFSIPATAGNGADWTLYGSARFQTFSNDVQGGWAPPAAAPDSDTDTRWEMDGACTRLGFKVQNGDVGGHAEIRPAGNNVRHWYGTWNFGAGQLLVGQTWSVLSTLYSNMGWDDKGLGSVGDNSYRTQMIKFTFGDAQIALVSPGTSAPNGTPVETTAANPTIWAANSLTVDTDTTLPKIEAAYHLGFDTFAFDFGAGYNTYDYVVEATQIGLAAQKDEFSVTSWYVQAGGTADFGPAYFKAQLYMAQNFNNYGGWDEHTDSSANLDYTNPNNPTLRDSDSFGFEVMFGFKVNEMLTLEAGYGSVKTEGDIDAATTFEDTASCYYLQGKITLADNVWVIPEFGKLDLETAEMTAGGVTNEREDGDTTYFGAKWQIDF